MGRFLLAVVLVCATPLAVRAQASEAWDRARGGEPDDEPAPSFAEVEAGERARAAAAREAALVEAVELPPRPRPPRHRTRRNYDYAGPGIAMFVGGWVATAVTTSAWYSQETHCTSLGWFSWRCTHDDFGDAGLAFGWVPLVGPWLMMTDATTQGATYALPVVAGLVQDVGFVLMLLGLLDQHDERVPARGGSLRALPYANGSGLGLLVDGRF